MTTDDTSGLEARRTQMTDGRYLIYFSFSESDAPSTTAPTTGKPEPDARNIATDSAVDEAALASEEKRSV